MKDRFSRLLAGSFVIWGFLIVLAAIALHLFPHSEVPLFALIRIGCLLLLGVVAYFVRKEELLRRNRVFFLCFFVYGTLIQILDFLVLFLSEVSTDWPFAVVYAYQYVSIGLTILWQMTIALVSMLAFAFGASSHRWMLQKSLAVSTVFFMVLFYPYLLNPNHLYETQEIEDYKVIYRVERNFFELNGRVATTDELTVAAMRGSVGERAKQEMTERVSRIQPYLDGKNYNLLLIKPLNRIGAYANGISLALIVIILGINYKRLLVANAYMEKIILILVPYFALESVHFYSYSRMTDYNDYLSAFSLASILSIFCITSLTILFIRRLRFLLSDVGAFYERKLRDAQDDVVTLWRDGIDNAVIRVFFKSTSILRRFAVWVGEQEKPASHTE